MNGSGGAVIARHRRECVTGGDIGVVQGSQDVQVPGPNREDVIIIHINLPCDRIRCCAGGGEILVSSEHQSGLDLVGS